MEEDFQKENIELHTPGDMSNKENCSDRKNEGSIHKPILIQYQVPISRSKVKSPLQEKSENMPSPVSFSKKDKMGDTPTGKVEGFASLQSSKRKIEISEIKTSQEHTPRKVSLITLSVQTSNSKRKSSGHASRKSSKSSKASKSSKSSKSKSPLKSLHSQQEDIKIELSSLDPMGITFIEDFKRFLNENKIAIVDMIPNCLTETGIRHLNNTHFWLCYFSYFFSLESHNLSKFIDLAKGALEFLHEDSEILLIQSYFHQLVEEKYTQEDIQNAFNAFGIYGQNKKQSIMSLISKGATILSSKPNSKNKKPSSKRSAMIQTDFDLHEDCPIQKTTNIDFEISYQTKVAYETYKPFKRDNIVESSLSFDLISEPQPTKLDSGDIKTKRKTKLNTSMEKNRSKSKTKKRYYRNDSEDEDELKSEDEIERPIKTKKKNRKSKKR